MNYSIVSRNGGDVFCIAAGSRQALSYGSSLGGAYDTNVGSAIVDTTGGPETLQCTGGPALELYSETVDAVSEVNFVRVDQVVAGTPTAARPGNPQDGGPASHR